MRADTELHAHAIEEAVLASVRESGVDPFGHRVESWTADGGDPLRCCLRSAEPGEQLLLMSYSPTPVDGPWQEIGPVFVHRENCGGWNAADGLPAQLRTGPRVLRAYRADGSMDYDALTVVPEGEDIQPALEKIFAREDVDEVHVRALVAQCFTYAVRCGH